MVDPAHYLYGLTLPLRGVTIKEPLGRVCVVDLAADRACYIPAAATDLDSVGPPRSSCRLSVAAIAGFLAVLATLPSGQEEDAPSGQEEDAPSGQEEDADAAVEPAVVGRGGGAAAQAHHEQGGADHAPSRGEDGLADQGGYMPPHAVREDWRERVQAGHNGRGQAKHGAPLFAGVVIRFVCPHPLCPAPDGNDR